jgi:hypothetical protein
LSFKGGGVEGAKFLYRLRAFDSLLTPSDTKRLLDERVRFLLAPQLDISIGLGSEIDPRRSRF